MKNSKWAIIGLIGLPFALVGGILGRQCCLIFMSSHPTLFALIMWPAGVMFSLFGWGLILILIFGKEVMSGVQSPLDQHRQLLGIRTPVQQWDDRHLVTQGKGHVIFAWFAAILAVLSTAPSLWIGVTHGFEQNELLYKFWCLVAVIPVYTSGKAIVKTLRWRKFGESTCGIEQCPSTDNPAFRCRIRSEKNMLEGGEATVDLRCEKREYQGIGKSRTLRVFILWDNEKTVPVQPAGLGIDASFTIPAELPDASLTPIEGIFWRLIIRSATHGIDYEAEFELAFKRGSV